MMNTKLTAAITAGMLVLGVGSTHADPYRLELDLSYITGDLNSDNFDVNEDNLAFGATYYFKEVVDAERILRETPFLSRASFLSGEVQISDLDDSLSNTVDSDSYSISGGLISEETGWYGKLGYINADASENIGEVASGFDGLGYEFDGYSLRIGKYILPNTTVEVGYNRIDIGGTQSLDDIGGANTDSTGIGIKHVGRISETVGYSVSASYYFIDLEAADFDQLDDLGEPEIDPFSNSGEVLSITGVVYPARTLGIGLSYADSDDLRGLPYLASTSELNDGAGLFVDWFITDDFSVRALYSNSDYDIVDFDDIDDIGSPSEVENDSISFRAGYRF